MVCCKPTQNACCGGVEVNLKKFSAVDIFLAVWHRRSGKNL